MKKIRLVMMGIIMIGLLQTSALADDAKKPYITVGIEVDAQEPLSIGDEITIVVSIAETSGYTGLSTELQYDQESFILVKATDLGKIPGSSPTPYDNTFFWTNPLELNDYTYTGPIVEYVFRVASISTESAQFTAIIGDVVNGVPEDGTGDSTTHIVNLAYDSSSCCEHVYDGGVIKIEPTCYYSGLMRFTCIYCGVWYEEFFNGEPGADGHLYDDGTITIEPTDSTEGLKTYTCEMCGKTFTETIPVLESGNYDFDINADDHIDTKDLIALMKHIVGLETATNTEAADANDDDIINILDVVRFMRFLALYGDVNGDGVVDAADVSRIVLYLNGEVSVLLV